MEGISGRLKWIVGIAFALRVAVLLYVLRAGFIIGEGRVLSDLATNLLSGRGYMLSPEMLRPAERAVDHTEMHDAGFEFYRRVDGFYGVLRPGRPTTFLVPGYVYFMSAVYAVAGVGSFGAVRAVQLVLVGMLSVLVGISIAKRFLSGVPLLLASLFMAVDPFEIYFEAIPATQALFSLAFLTSMLLSLRAVDRWGTGSAILAGAAWGLTFLIRPVALLGAGVLAICFALAHIPVRRRVLLVAASSMTTAAAVLPWALWMYTQTGQFGLSPTQGGVNLWEFNARPFSSYYVDEQEGMQALYGPLRSEFSGRLSRPDLAEFPEFRDEPEAFRDSVLTGRTLAFLRANPELFARMLLIRFADFVKPFSFNQASPARLVLGFLTWGVVLLFAAGGALVMLRKRDPGAFLLLGTVFLYSLFHVATVAGIPYRVAIDFPAAVFAAAGLGEMAGRIRASRCRTLPAA